MSDFSLFSLFTAGLACIIPLTAAYTQPKGAEPSGNPISQPGLNSVVPVGEGFTITWDPTTQGTVTLVLLKGPSTNAVPQYPIVEKTPNNGSYVWTPSKDLAPSDPSTPAKGYGIQLIVDSNGQYQYTTQFGISNPDYKASSYSSSSSAATPTGYGSHSTTASPTGYSSHSASATKTGSLPPAYTPSNLPKPTWYTKTSGVHNVTMVAPTYAHPTYTSSVSAPAYTSSASNATTTSGPYKGSASTMAASFGSLIFAAAVAVVAF